MDKYTRYMIRQHFLNQMMPPLESHKVFGSHFLYDLLQMHIFFSTSNSNTTSSLESIEYDGPTLEEIKQHWKDGYNEGDQLRKQKLFEFMSLKSKNPIILIGQFAIKYIMGCILLLYKLMGKKLEV